jgi:hypothetical protein
VPRFVLPIVRALQRRRLDDALVDWPDGPAQVTVRQKGTLLVVPRSMQPPADFSNRR